MDTFASFASVMNIVSWIFVGWMVLRLVMIVSHLPEQKNYPVPQNMDIPQVINEHSLPTLPNERHVGRTVHNIFASITTRIRVAADEKSVYSFLKWEFETIQEGIIHKYEPIIGQIDNLGFEGIIGTLIGLVTFLAQASGIFTTLSNITIDPEKTSAIVESLLSSFKNINLVTVSFAFVTSIIGWAVKAYVGGCISSRRGSELYELNKLERWIQTNIISVLSMDSKMRLTIPALEKVAEQLRQTTNSSKDAVDEMAKQINQAVDGLERMTEILNILLNMRFKVDHVEGGIQ